MRSLLLSLGGAAYPRAPTLRHEAFAPSSARVAEQLTADTGNMVAGDHLDLFDSPLSWPDQLVTIFDWLATKRASPPAPPESIVVHYVGHGSTKIGSSDYYLTINSTVDQLAPETSATLSSLNELLRKQARSMRVYYIVDACYAAESLRDLMAEDGDGPLLGKLRGTLASTDDLGELADHGVAALCSSDKYETSSARGRSGVTQFTDGLITALETGDPKAGSHLSFRRVAAMTRKSLSELYGDHAIKPVLFAPQTAHGEVSQHPIFVNRAMSQSERLFAEVSEEQRAELNERVQTYVDGLFNSLNDDVEFEKSVDQVRSMGRRELAEMPRAAGIEDERPQDLGVRLASILAEDSQLAQVLRRIDPRRRGPLLSELLSRSFGSRRSVVPSLVERTALVQALRPFGEAVEAAKHEILMDQATIHTRRAVLIKSRSKLAQMCFIAWALRSAIEQRARADASESVQQSARIRLALEVADRRFAQLSEAKLEADRTVEEMAAKKAAYGECVEQLTQAASRIFAAARAVIEIVPRPGGEHSARIALTTQLDAIKQVLQDLRDSQGSPDIGRGQSGGTRERAGWDLPELEFPQA